MKPERIKYLKGFCHDSGVELKSAKRCGKKLVDIEFTVSLFVILEEILNHLETDEK